MLASKPAMEYNSLCSVVFSCWSESLANFFEPGATSVSTTMRWSTVCLRRGALLMLAIHVASSCSVLLAAQHDLSLSMCMHTKRARQTRHGRICAGDDGCIAQRMLVLRGGGDEPKADEQKGREKIERDKALIGELQAMRIACRQLKERIQTLDDEILDHTSAAQVLEKYNGTRACKRAIGGVLIDSTAEEVLHSLRHENKLLTKASDELSGKLAEAEKQMNEFQQKHDIRIHTPNE